MGISYLYPDSTLDSGAIVVSGSSLSAAWSDNSDATYATWSLSSGYGSVGFTTVAVPAGALASTVAPTLRMSTAAGSVTVYVGVYVMRYGTPVLIGSGTARWQYQTGTMTFPAFPVVLYTQAELDSILIQVDVDYDESVPPTFRVYQANLTVKYAEVPTVTVSAPTGVQATSTPTLAWATTAGTDGGPITQHEVKVLSLAQYSGLATDAAITAATGDYNSTPNPASPTSLSTGPLQNSTTYRAYARSGQTVNGVQQWSLWAFSSFSTLFTAPIISTTVATTSNAGGYNTVTVTRQSTAPNTAWQKVSIERSTDGGVTYRPMRGCTDSTTTNSFITTWAASSVVARDYDAGNGQSVIYRARAFTNASGSDVWGAWVYSSAVAWASVSDIWVKDPLVPSRNVITAPVREMPAVTWSRTVGEFQVVGRPDPITISDVMSTSRGSLTLCTATNAAATSLRLLKDSSPIWLVQLPAPDQFGSKYLQVFSMSEVRPSQVMGDPYRFWEVQYVEVSSPVDQT